jgi:sugar (pentulose or hexulose) kinase
MMNEGDAGMAEICRTSLTRLATEVRNSIGFFEGQHEETIHRIFVSGGLARTETILQTLSDELGLPCEIWTRSRTAKFALPAAKRQALPNEFVSAERRVRRRLRIPAELRPWLFKSISSTRKSPPNAGVSAIR